jgi:hypothetical protein
MVQGAPRTSMESAVTEIDWRKRSIEMHRRAQKAEGVLMKMQDAHKETAKFSFKKLIDYHLYGSILLNCYPSLFPKSAGFTDKDK